MAQLNKKQTKKQHYRERRKFENKSEAVLIKKSGSVKEVSLRRTLKWARTELGEWQEGCCCSENSRQPDQSQESNNYQYRMITSAFSLKFWFKIYVMILLGDL